jgi:hypothetical protein
MSNIWCNRCHKLLATPWCPECDKPNTRIAELEAENKRLRDALGKVEWGWVSLGNGSYHEVCAWCRGFKQHGHKPDCARQSALRREGEKE